MSPLRQVFFHADNTDFIDFDSVDFQFADFLFFPFFLLKKKIPQTCSCFEV